GPIEGGIEPGEPVVDQSLLDSPTRGIVLDPAVDPFLGHTRRGLVLSAREVRDSLTAGTSGLQRSVEGEIKRGRNVATQTWSDRHPVLGSWRRRRLGRWDPVMTDTG